MLFEHITRPYHTAKRRLEISLRKIMLDMIDDTVNNRLKNGKFVITQDILDDTVEMKWSDGTN